MFEKYKEFYSKIFKFPIAIDELSPSHFPNYEGFEKFLKNNIKNNLHIKHFKNHKSFIGLLQYDDEIKVSQPEYLKLTISPFWEVGREDVFKNIMLEEAILHYSSYAYTCSNSLNQFYIELPQRVEQSYKVEFITNFTKSVIYKKTYLVPKHISCSIDEKYTLSNNSIISTDLIIGEESNLEAIADLSQIKSEESAINYMVVLNNKSKLDFYLLGLAKGIVFINLYIILNGFEAQANIRGSYLGRKTDNCTLIVFVNHKVGRNQSNVHINNVLFDNARNFFFGLIKVEKNSTLVDAFETNKNLILSKQARTISIPKLEIENNNLRCSHSSSVSSLDDNIVFYLKSRGIRYEDIIKIASKGFLLETLPHEVFEEPIEKALTTLNYDGQ